MVGFSGLDLILMEWIGFSCLKKNLSIPIFFHKIVRESDSYLLYCFFLSPIIVFLIFYETKI